MVQPVWPRDETETIFGPTLVRKMTVMQFLIMLRRPSSHGWTLIALLLGTGWILAGGRVVPAVLVILVAVPIFYLEHWVRIRQPTARDFGVGSMSTTLFGDEEMIFSGTGVCTRMRYDGIDRLWQLRDGIVLTHFGLFGVTRLPRSIIPPHGRDRLISGAGVAGASESSPTYSFGIGPGSDIARSFTADRRTVSRLVRASPECGGRPYWTRLAGLALLGVIVSGLWWSRQGRIDREFALLLGVWLICLGLRVIRDRRRVGATMAAAYASGRVLVGRFSPWGMTYGSHLVSTTCTFAAFDRLDVINGVVLLRLPRYGTLMFPVEFVPDSVVARLRAVIGAEQP